MKKKILTFSIFCILINLSSLFGQHGDSISQNISFPLEIPMSVSGTFGELRTNALHAGFDFRTQGKTGFSVHAIDSGYVSRIKIEPGGYGRAVYINHPNGLTSVYAHLEKLNPELDFYTKNEQYRLLQFRVDLFPPKDSLKIKKGDIIGLSGNAGSSTGPHLHLEIRDANTQVPLNFVKKLHFEINDTLPPSIQSIWIYPLGKNSRVNKNDSLPYVFKLKNNDFKILADSTPEVWGEIGLGIDAIDPVKNNINKSGIYSIELYLDRLLIFNQVLDEFSFDEVRYVNSLIDYGEFINSYNRINRLFVQPNNKLNIYKKAITNGIISVNDTLTHEIKIIVYDINQNKQEIGFKIKGKNYQTESNRSQKNFSKNITCGMDQVFEDKNCKVSFFQNSIYDNLEFEFNTFPQETGFYSEFYQIHNKYTPIHQAVKLQIKQNNLPDSLRNKALLASVDGRKIIWCGGYYKNNRIEAYIRNFGIYAVIVDTIAPVIIPIKGKSSGTDYSKEQIIGFTITDDLSGISNYNGYIDGGWALFEYDAKNNFLYYEFDSTRITYGTNHTLDLIVTDERGNQREFRTDFYK